MPENTIGAVHAEFTASTTGTTAALKEVDAQFTKTVESAKAADAQMQGVFASLHRRANESMADFRRRAMAAQSAAEKVAASERLQGDVTASQAERARRAWERELIAQERRVVAATQVARTEEMAALKNAILARSNTELGKSAQGVAARYLAMAASVRESMGVMGEKIAKVAERAELSTDGIAAGFGGLGKLFGAGIVGDLFLHMLDNVADLNVELADLHEKTGMAVEDLAGLRMIAQSKSLDFTTISMGLTRMGRAMYEAQQGMKEDVEAFTSLGISMKEVATDSPTEMLYRISKALKENRDLVLSDGTALEIFGRGGKELIPILQEYGGELEGAVQNEARLTGVTKESARASQQWLLTTTRLSTRIHSELNPALIELVKWIPYVASGLDMLAGGFVEAFGTIGNVIVTAADALWQFAKANSELSTFHWVAAWHDAQKIGPAFRTGYDAEKKIISYANQKALAARVDWETAGLGLDTPIEGESRARHNPDGVLVQAARADLAERERTAQTPLTRKQLIDFWTGFLGKTKRGTIDYTQVSEIIGRLKQGAKPTASGGTRAARSIDASSGNFLRGLSAASEGDRFLQDFYHPPEHDNLQQISGRIAFQGALGPLWDVEQQTNLDAISKAWAKASDGLPEFVRILDAANKEMNAKVVLAEQASDAARTSLNQYFSQFSGPALAGNMAVGSVETFNRGLLGVAMGRRNAGSAMLRNLEAMGFRGAIGGVENRFLRGPLEGLLGGGKPGTSESNALWVRVAGANARLRSPIESSLSQVGSLIPKMPSGIAGALKGASGFLAHMIPGFAGFFADGGFLPSGMPAIVGERGPELFMPRTSGTIVPNDRIGGAGDTHIHIDARGATDPAATAVAVQRAIRQMGHAAVHQAVHAMHETKARTPRG